MRDEDIVKFILANRGLSEKRIKGALISCIDAHGPITKGSLGSATKRIWGQIRGMIKELREREEEEENV